MIEPNYESRIRSGEPLRDVLNGCDAEKRDRDQVIDAVRVYLEHHEVDKDTVARARAEIEDALPDYADDPEIGEVIDDQVISTTIATSWFEVGVRIGAPMSDGHGRFRILEQIGNGGQSAIYKAVDLENANDESVYVTIKFYRNFDEREGVRAKKIGHPNLVPFITQGTTNVDGEPIGYIVYKYLDGITLDEWARRLSPSRKSIIRVMIKLASAVVAMHGVGIFHRDLKPANIVMVDDEPIIIDYGVSVLGDEPGSQAGTPVTMAPEQLTHIVHSARVDIYGLGAVAYYMLTLRFPNGQTPEEALENLRNGVEPDCSSIGGPLGFVLSRCLSKHIPRRYESASALESDLVAILEQRPTSVQRSSAVLDCALFMSRHPMMVTILAVVLGIIAWYAIVMRADRDRYAYYREISIQAMIQSMVQIQLDHDHVDPAAYVILGELGQGMKADWTQLTNLMDEQGELMLRDYIESLAADPGYSRIKLHYWYVTLARVQLVVYEDPDPARVSYINARNALLETLGPDDPLVRDLEEEMRTRLPSS